MLGSGETVTFPLSSVQCINCTVSPPLDCCLILSSPYVVSIVVWDVGEIVEFN